MTTPKTTASLKAELNQINSLDDLMLEERRVRLRIRMQEQQLKEVVSKLPGELVHAGIKSVVPGFIAGKVTNTALSGIRSGVNFLFSNHEKEKGFGFSSNTDADQRKAGTIAKLAKGLIKKVGVVTAARFAFNLLLKRKLKL